MVDSINLVFDKVFDEKEKEDLNALAIKNLAEEVFAYLPICISCNGNLDKVSIYVEIKGNVVNLVRITYDCLETL